MTTNDLPPSGAQTNASGPSGPLANVRLSTVVLATLVVLGIALLFAFVIRFHLILFLFLVALILATVTRPSVDWLARRGVAPQVGVLLIYIALLAVIVLLLALVTPLIINQVSAISSRLPTLYTDLRQALTSTDNRLVQRLANGLPAQVPLPGSAAAPAVTGDELPSFASAWSLVKLVSRAGFFTIAVMALAFYWVIEGDLITRRALLFVRAERREQARAVWAEMEDKIGAFFRGQLLLMGVVGGLSALGYSIIGIPHALGLGLIAGFLEAIPMFGPVLTTLVAAMVALALAPDKFLAAILVGVIVQLLENNLLVPRIMDQSVGINPIITILAIAALGQLFGFVGVLMAIPLAAMGKIVLQRLLSMRNVPPEVGRKRIDMLRLTARELIVELRKGMADQGNALDITQETESVEDKLEAIATDLETMLAAVEAKA